MTTSSDDADSPLSTLLLCPQFSGERWQLPVDEAYGDRVLIGWRTQRQRIDSGIPHAVARLFARALCQHSMVTFAKGLRSPVGAGLLPRRWRSGRDFIWISTGDPDEAAPGIFDDELFSWARQGQIVLLSRAGHALTLDERALQLPGAPSVVGMLRDLSVHAAFLPGVDGDVAGLYTFDSMEGDHLRRDLVDSCGKVGAIVDVLDEPAFARSVAGV